jgi:hypothetical protein
MYALYESVRYIVSAGIAGDIVECGVWRGGSAMIAALTLVEMDASRRMWLYHTFEGMPPPGDYDVYSSGEHAREILQASDPLRRDHYQARAGLDEVRTNIAATGHADVQYVVGRVEDTIPHDSSARDCIAATRYGLV